jgi:hypothetical protein
MTNALRYLVKVNGFAFITLCELRLRLRGDGMGSMHVSFCSFFVESENICVRKSEERLFLVGCKAPLEFSSPL